LDSLSEFFQRGLCISEPKFQGVVRVQSENRGPVQSGDMDLGRDLKVPAGIFIFSTLLEVYDV